MSMQLGAVLLTMEDPESGAKPTWAGIQSMARTAETVGFDTVWVPDELLWWVPGWDGPRGWWECVAMAGAVAATTSTIGVGTWVMSALHRNPGLTAKVAHTLDEISSGRFVLGFGAGHAGDQGATFGYPEDVTVARYEEALEILIPALRGQSVTFDGQYHRSRDLDIRPNGPRDGRIPVMLGGHGPRTMRLAAKHADIWSGYGTESSLPSFFEPMLERLDEACAEVGRDTASLQRSVGVFVEPNDGGAVESLGLGMSISGSTDQIVDTVGRFESLGIDRVEIMPWPMAEQTLATLAPVIQQLRR